MAYQKINFLDQNVERPRTYEMQQNQDGTVTLIDSFGVITEIGTPINRENMNHIEDGIVDCNNQLTTLNSSISTLSIDMSDVKNRVYLKASYRSGRNGYIIYSNGFCIQWGQTASVGYGATVTIQLLKKFADTNYTMSGSTPYVQTAGDKGSSWAITSLNQNSFTWRSGFQQTSSYIRWQAIGFLAEGEY